MSRLSCKYCRSPNTKIIEKTKNEDNNYVASIYKCLDCNKKFKSYELIEDSLFEKNCVYCGNEYIAIRKNTKYCDKCKTLINLTKNRFRANNSKKNEEKLRDMENTILENVRKHTTRFVPVDNINEMTHYLYSFMGKDHPKKLLKDTRLSKKELYKYFYEGAIIGYKLKEEE